MKFLLHFGAQYGIYRPNKILLLAKSTLRCRQYSLLPEPFLSFKTENEANLHIEKLPDRVQRSFEEHVAAYRYLDSTNDILSSHRDVLKREYKKLYGLNKNHIEDISMASMEPKDQPAESNYRGLGIEQEKAESYLSSKENKAEPKEYNVSSNDLNVHDKDYKYRQLIVKNALCTVYSLFLRKNKHLEKTADKRVTKNRYFEYNCLGIEGRKNLEDEYLKIRSKLMKMFLIDTFPEKKKYKKMIISPKYAKREYFTIMTLPKLFRENKDLYYSLKDVSDIKEFAVMIEHRLQEEYNNLTLKETLANYIEAYSLLYTYAKRDKSIFLKSSYDTVVNIFENVIPELTKLFEMYLKCGHRTWPNIKYHNEKMNPENVLKPRTKIPLFSGHNLAELSKAHRALKYLIKFAKLNAVIKKNNEDLEAMRVFTPVSKSRDESLKKLMKKNKKFSPKSAEQEFFDSLF